jgi:hypothetical protein
MTRAAPPVFPFPYHRALGDRNNRMYAFKQGEQRIMKGWWPRLPAK